MTRKSDAARPREKVQRKRRRALDAYARLQRAAALAASAADASLAPFSLSASQLGVLETLQSRGPLHQQELARALGRSKAQMTAIIDALEKRGLAVRERHPTDRRFTTVHLTSGGTDLLDDAMPVRAEAVVAIMNALSGDQRTRLGRLCRRLIKALAPDEDARDSGDEDDGELSASGRRDPNAERGEAADADDAEADSDDDSDDESLVDERSESDAEAEHADEARTEHEEDAESTRAE